MPMASLPATFAAAAARQANTELRAHKLDCRACKNYHGRRNDERPCDTGWRLMQAVTRTAVALAEEKKLDAAPVPGQGMLFDIDPMGREK